MASRYFLDWCRVLAEEYGGRYATTGSGVRIDPSSDKWNEASGSAGPILLAPFPKDAPSWRARLQHVEKACARAIISGPVGFSCVVSNKASKHPGELTNVIRLAFGLFLSLGPSHLTRYTAYYAPTLKKGLHLLGSDELFQSCTEVQSLSLTQKNLTATLPPLLDLVSNVEQEYIAQPSVKESLSRLSDVRSAELRELDRLYTANYGQDAKLLGRSNSLKGEDAIEAEYFSRMGDILEKYKPAVIFKPLSLGIIRTTLTRDKKVQGTKLALSFVPQNLPPSAPA